MLTVKSFTNTGCEHFRNGVCLVWDSVSEEWVHRSLADTGKKKKKSCLLSKWTLYKNMVDFHVVARVSEITARKNDFNLMSNLLASQWRWRNKYFWLPPNTSDIWTALNYPDAIRPKWLQPDSRCHLALLQVL